MNLLLKIRYWLSLILLLWNLLIHVDVLYIFVVLLALGERWLRLLLIYAIVRIEVLWFVEVRICLEFGRNSLALVKALEKNFGPSGVLLAFKLWKLLLELSAVAVQRNASFLKLWPLGSVLTFADCISGR